MNNKFNGSMKILDITEGFAMQIRRARLQLSSLQSMDFLHNFSPGIAGLNAEMKCGFVVERMESGKQHYHASIRDRMRVHA